MTDFADDIFDSLDLGTAGGGLSRNPDAIRQRRWRERNQEINRLRNQVYQNNSRARKMGCAGTITASEWLMICAKYGCRCVKCGRLEQTIDHVIPLEHGGLNVIENVQPLCGFCNKSKGTAHTDFRGGNTCASRAQQPDPIHKNDRAVRRMARQNLRRRKLCPQQ